MDSLEIRRRFAKALFSESPLYSELYDLLVRDENADVINYNKFGVPYSLRALKFKDKTIIKILILRTNSKQHKQVIDNSSVLDKGFYLECKREVVDSAQFNRGALLFMRNAGVPLQLVVDSFFKLSLDKRVINISHAMGDFENPSNAYSNFETTLKSGYGNNVTDTVQYGHDVANVKSVEILYRTAIVRAQKLYNNTKSKKLLMLVGFNVFGPEDAFNLH